jgi:TonB family protein
VCIGDTLCNLATEADAKTMPRLTALPAPLLFLVLLAVSGCASSGRSLELVSGSAVVYPPEAHAQGIEGYVIVQYDVDATGRVINAEVIEAEPAGVFDAAALETVSSWRFRPARGSRQPEVIERVRSRVEFSIDAGAAYRGL